MAFSLSPTTGFDFESSLSPSERIDAAKYFAPSEASAPTLWEKAQSLDIDVVDAYTSDLDLGGILGLDSTLFAGGFGASTQPGWTFITAPEDVSWDVGNQASRVDIFGTNNPPVVAGSRGMRDLTLGNALVEGFVRNVTIEGKIAALENLMNYSLNTSDGFVSVPVYQVWANNKSYGGSEAYYIIKDVKIKETMRDLKGDATRAYVDISLMQVPAYQVNSGRDQASEVTAGGAALSPTQKAQATVNGQANQKVTGPGGAAAGAAGSKPSSGANSATPPPPAIDLEQRRSFRPLPQ